MRHKWKKKVNHPYCHERVCVKCGCIKDTTSMTNTIYWLNGEKFFNAPECKPIKRNSMILLKDVIHLYLGCSVQIKPEEEDRRVGTFVGFTDQHKLSINVAFRAGPLGRVNILFIKPILRPLSDITGEEIIEWGERSKRPYDMVELKKLIPKYKKLFKEKGLNAMTVSEGDFELVPNLFVFLLSKSFDLFDLIPSGQAIDATTINK